MRLYARRFTVQERLGEQIADALVSLIAPRGVAVHLEASHLCTQMRGVEAHSRTITTFWRGAFDDAELRREFLAEVRAQRRGLATVGDVALVCGAGGALGGALVEAFLARGDRVVAVDRSGRRRASEGVRREAADLTSADEVDALWARLEADGDAPRWVVNAAGGFRGGTRRRVRARRVRVHARPEPRHRVVVVPRGGAAAARGGAIVNVARARPSSGGTGSAAYAVSKAGVVRLTQVLADELKERRVRVNAILPSLIDTPGEPRLDRAEPMARRCPAEHRLGRRVPLQRRGRRDLGRRSRSTAR